MNYDTIIVELLSRVQMLEQQVKELQLNQSTAAPAKEAQEKITTKDIKTFIESLKLEAKENGEEYVVLVARDINKKLHLKNSYPMVCNAMRQSMSERDETVFSPASGYSSTLEIKYYI